MAFSILLTVSLAERDPWCMASGGEWLTSALLLPSRPGAGWLHPHYISPQHVTLTVVES